MSRIPILGGAYRQASLIAGAQRAVNIYPEDNSQKAQAPVNVSHYSRPGNTPLSAPPILGAGRGLFVTSLGDLYASVAQGIFYINPDWQWTQVGSLLVPATTPVSFSDNGVNGIFVDNSTFGLNLNLAARTATPVADPNWLGATRADFLDYFLIFNKPGTPIWYSSMQSSIAFQSLMFGIKTAWPDNIVTLIANERQAWLLGKYKSEVWANAGTVPFPFNVLSGNIVEHGCVAPYAVCKNDVNVYWLSESPEGARMAVRGALLQAQRISTHAIEEEWLEYPRVDDCICSTFQMRGHVFILYHFPTADRTWVFDEATKEWHEWAYFDTNGIQHRSKVTYMAYAYGKNIGQDWNTGQIYLLDETNYSDNGAPIVYKRGMPHVLDNDNETRITCWRLIADMECGNGTGVQVPQLGGIGSPWSLGFNPGFGPSGATVLTEPPMVTLRVSRDRGAYFYTHSVVPLGATGMYNQRPTFNRIGYAYDFVFELSWAGPMHTGLNGAFITVEKHEGDE